ncbi:MAG: vanadium-dependent haloperoxidase [Usitatibacter sp.]
MHPTRCFLCAAILLFPAVCAADVILDWNDVALARVVAARQGPPDGARTMAMVHVAMFDAIDAVDHRYAPYAFKGRAPAGTSAEAAGVAASAEVLAKLFPDQAQAVDAAYAASMAAIPDGDGKAAGIALGRQVGADCLSMREKDGTGVPAAYRPKTAPGVYVMTVMPAAAEWPKVKPWFMTDGAQFRPGPPPALTSALWARDYNEIKLVGARQSTARTPEQTEAARFWTIVGAPSWNPVVRSLASSRPLGLVDNARLFALVNMAASDAFVAVFDAKYFHHFWRPVTAIRNGDIDGNDATALDPEWLPLVDTPLHPEYPCAHCITAGAIGEVLEAQFGRGDVPPITMTSPTAPGVTHRWTRISDYVGEVDNARIWGGIHYRNSTQVGEAMGRRIGALAVQGFMQPAP